MEFKFYKTKLFLCSSLIFFSSINQSLAESIPNVWEVLRNKFTLNHETSRAEVQEQIQWLVAHPGYLQKACYQSKPYIYHIVLEIKKRNLPGELALLPLIESAYNPFAYSGAGASGLWQLMPSTASDLGLKQDWWFDGRRSIRLSTDAALNYLTYLNKVFNGDWILAIAAYDSGEGAIARAIKATPNRRLANFWELLVPQETQIYVPRFLALAEIFSNPNKYKLALPEIPYLPYFAEVDIGSQIDLNNAAKMAGISFIELIKLNPGFNRWATAPYKPFKLLIPTEKVYQFKFNLANLPEEQRVMWEKHIVKPGDSLDKIALRYHTTVNLIKQLNQLTTNYIRINQSILIPSTKNTSKLVQKEQNSATIPLEYQLSAPRNHRIIHIVQDKDTYQKLETTYGVRTKDIQIWNKLESNQPLFKGQQLVIWKRVYHPIQYMVKKGDSLSNIAQHHQTKIERIIALNPGLNRNTPLYQGQKILVG